MITIAHRGHEAKNGQGFCEIILQDFLQHLLPSSVLLSATQGDAGSAQTGSLLATVPGYRLVSECRP